MALNALERSTIIDGFKAAQIVLESLKPMIDQLNVIYDSDDGVKEMVDQADLDSDPAMSGITKAQLDDGMFALTSTIKTAITNTMTQLAQLSARA